MSINASVYPCFISTNCVKIFDEVVNINYRLVIYTILKKEVLFLNSQWHLQQTILSINVEHIFIWQLVFEEFETKNF